MPTLILLRHAKSEYPLGVPDHDRPLSTRGLRDAQSIGSHLKPFLAPNRSLGVAVSTARRAQQTWEVARAGLSSTQLPEQVWNDASLYLAEPDQIVEASRCFETEVGLIVGHNPGLAELAATATATGAGVTEQLATKFPTSTFAILDLGGQDWGSWSSAECTDVVICR